MLFNKKIFIILFIISFLIFSIINHTKVSAHSSNSIEDTTKQDTTIFIPPPVEDNGAPGGNREGAGSYSLCKMPQTKEQINPLIALMPEVAINNSTETKKYIWGQIASAHSVFWFYVAYPVNSYVEFTIQDEAENELYQTTFSLDKTKGIISLFLPQDTIYLETGKSYHWYFNIMCNSEDSTDDFVEGWIEKVELNSVIQAKLKSASPLEKVSLYAENGFWYDTLANLALLRQNSSKAQEFDNRWADLLRQVGLNIISNKPIVRHYILK